MKNSTEYKIIGFYILGLILLLGTIQVLFVPQLFSEQNLLNWDAIHYFSISKKGYDSSFIVAFFPLFPMIWKFLHLGIYGLVFFNATLFLISFSALVKTMHLKREEVLLFLSVPSFLFFYLPYSEAVFFASSVLLLVSIQQKRFWIVLFGLFICSIARPSFTVLLPALLVMELFGEVFNWQLVKRCLAYVLTSFFGLLLVGMYQFYFQRQEWFTFFSAQKMWGNELRVPAFPLTSWGGGLATKIDAFALLIGILSGLTLLLFFMKSSRVKKITIPKEVVLSLAYLAGISLTVLFFRGGSLFSLNRFVFACPFVLVGLNFYLKQTISFNWKTMSLILFLLIAYGLLFGSYLHIQVFLKYFALALYMFLLFGMKSHKEGVRRFSLYSFIILNFFFQIFLYCYFLMTDEGGGFVA